MRRPWMPIGLLLSGTVLAANMPIRLYTTADGLPHNWVTCIRRDPVGYLWFGTREGVARFDGYTFSTYGRTDGLSNTDISSMLVSHSGDLWVGTSAGLFRFQPTARPHFLAYKSSAELNAARVTSLTEGRDGAIWLGTAGGLFRLDAPNDPARPPVLIDQAPVTTVLEGRDGSLWVAGTVVFRLRPDGSKEVESSLGNRALLEAADGSIWAGGSDSLIQWTPNKSRSYNAADGLRKGASILFQTSDGRLWIDSFAGLSQLVPQESTVGEPPIRPFGPADRMATDSVRALGEDREGNLWVGCTFGAMKVVRNAFTTYDKSDGLGDTRIASIFENHAGEMFVITTGEAIAEGAAFLNRRVGNRFQAEPIRPPYGAIFTSGWNQIALFDRLGVWWSGTNDRGICRYNIGKSQGQPGECFVSVPKASQDVGRMFEDSRGDIWAAVDTNPTGLLRWDRRTGVLREFTAADGVPPRGVKTSFRIPTAFREDRAGALWIGASQWIARYRNGRFQVFSDPAKFGNLFVTDLHLDGAGRLWIAGNEAGLFLVKDPSADQPEFSHYTESQGLSSGRILCVTSDKWGRVYVCTGRGIDRLEPDSEAGAVRTRHYTVADGLALGTTQEAFRDQDGTLWFGSLNGLSSFRPEPDLPRDPPPVFISSLRIQGVNQPLSELGQAKVAGLTLAPGQNHIEIGFVGLGFAAGETLRYEFRLEGAEREWNTPTAQRSVNYASLAPGHYRFLVRALNSMAQPSRDWAEVDFTVLAPLWQRWWFLTICGLGLATAIFSISRYRLKNALALERVRIRIATDLHDDVGASLSQIAILSEVARARNRPVESDPLQRIADISRELTDSMSDIVWAISPRHDRMLDLTRRMREFAEQMLVPLDLKLDFQADIPSDLRAGADVRRQVYLMFKECINNIARHAGCSKVTVRARVDSEFMDLIVTDDGRGFEGSPGDGNGLRNLRQRTASLGGHCAIESQPGKGTSVSIRIPSRSLRS